MVILSIYIEFFHSMSITAEKSVTYILFFFSLEEKKANRTLTILMSYLSYLYIKLIIFRHWKYFNNFTDHIWDIYKLMLCICEKM